jgi:hypothetical protein
MVLGTQGVWPGSRWNLTRILLRWIIWWACNNASRWQMGFNSAFKGLRLLGFNVLGYCWCFYDGFVKDIWLGFVILMETLVILECITVQVSASAQVQHFRICIKNHQQMLNVDCTQLVSWDLRARNIWHGRAYIMPVMSGVLSGKFIPCNMQGGRCML